MLPDIRPVGETQNYSEKSLKYFLYKLLPWCIACDNSELSGLTPGNCVSRYGYRQQLEYSKGVADPHSRGCTAAYDVGWLVHVIHGHYLHAVPTCKTTF